MKRDNINKITHSYFKNIDFVFVLLGVCRKVVKELIFIFNLREDGVRI